MDKLKSTRNKILPVATRHFAEFGFEGARMDRIAKEARVNKASIYYNIGNKQALYAAVLNEAFERQFASFHGMIESDIPAEEKLTAYVMNLGQAIEKNPDLPKIMMREQLSRGKNLPESFADKIVQLLDTLTSILEQGRKEGVFHDTDTMTIHFMIFGAMVFQMTTSPIRKEKKAFANKYQPDPGILPQGVVEGVVQAILRAVKRRHK